jgi:hypothetical protein
MCQALFGCSQFDFWGRKKNLETGIWIQTVTIVLQNGGSEIAQPKIDLVSSVVADSPHKVHCCFFSLYFIETALPQFWFNFWWLFKSGNFFLSEAKHNACWCGFYTSKQASGMWNWCRRNCVWLDFMFCFSNPVISVEEVCSRRKKLIGIDLVPHNRRSFSVAYLHHWHQTRWEGKCIYSLFTFASLFRILQTHTQSHIFCQWLCQCVLCLQVLLLSNVLYSLP